MNPVFRISRIIDEILLSEEELSDSDLSFIRRKRAGIYDLDRDEFHPLNHHRYHDNLLASLPSEFRTGKKHYMYVAPDVYSSPDGRKTEIDVKYNLSHRNPSEREKEKIEKVVISVKNQLHREFKHIKIDSFEANYPNVWPPKV